MATKVPARKMARKAPARRAKKAKPTAAPKQAAAQRPRRLRLPSYRPFRLKRIKYPEHLPSVWRLTALTAQIAWRNKRAFIGIALIYGILNLVLVRGLSGGADIGSLKQQLSLGFGGQLGQLVTGFTVFVSLLGSSGNDSSATAGAYQLFLGLLASLAAIWAARQVTGGQVVRIRDAFYKGMYPLVPFILVLLVVLLQTTPFLLGGGLFVLVTNTGIAASVLEQLLWGTIFAVLAIVSIYLLCSSLFALYIVTLPDMTPMKALRSARQLARYRRGQIFRKVLFLPVALLVIAAVIMVPLIIVVPIVAQWVFFVLSMAGLIMVHIYMYTLYKALLA